MIFGLSLGWIVLAIIIYFGIGALWYSPVMFAGAWAKELGKKQGDMSGASSAMVTTFLAMVVLVFVEAYMVQQTGVHGLWQGLRLGAILWLGFAGATALINNAFQGASRKLFAIDQGYHLVGIMLAGAILAH